MTKVAIITGGASGIGLYVATSLSQSGEWSVHIVDINASQGETAASEINATFHKCDITDYDSLAAVFKKAYQQYKRLDFVHANAGIIEPPGFIGGDIDTEEPPPPPNMRVVDVNLKAVIKTSWLAVHYMRLTRKTLGDENWEGNLVMTSSDAGLYVIPGVPMYSAAKTGVVGLTRGLAPPFNRDHHIRVNCICPGLVVTGMTAKFNPPREYVTPSENVVKAVRMLIEGKESVDSAGVKVEAGQMYGRVVEVSMDTFRFIDPPEIPASLKALFDWNPKPEGR